MNKSNFNQWIGYITIKIIYIFFGSQIRQKVKIELTDNLNISIKFMKKDNLYKKMLKENP